MIEAELGDYLPPEELAGLAMCFRSELAKLQRIQTVLPFPRRQ